MLMSTTRRSFLLGAGAAAAPLTAVPKRRKNVLFIASDDLNTCLSCYGHPVVRTPNIDRIARQGVRFDRAYCQYALCSPSRSSLMTGMAPDTTGVYDLQRHFRETLPDVVTLPQLFQKNGYFTARAGKIYHYGVPGQIGTSGLDDPPSWNKFVNPSGVDHTREEALLTFSTPQRTALGSSVAYHASSEPDEKHTDGMVAEAIMQMMSERRNEPWFLGAGFYRPHCPYIAPAKYFDQIPLNRVDLIPFDEAEMHMAPRWAYFNSDPNMGMTPEQRRNGMRPYFAAIEFMDARSEVVVVAIHQAVAEASILHQRDVRPADLQSRVRIAGALSLAQEDRIAALVRDVRRIVEGIEEDRGQVAGDVLPGRSVFVAQAKRDGHLRRHLPDVVQIDRETGGAELHGRDLRGNFGQRDVAQQE